jgi:DNA polymerase III epsilon subunit-like protein
MIDIQARINPTQVSGAMASAPGADVMQFMPLVVLIAITLIITWLVHKGRQQSVRTSAKPDLSMLPERFIVFDLETTGLRSDTHEIIEIGAIRVNRDSDLHETFSTLVIPTGRVSSKITSLTGLDREMLTAGGQGLKPALDEFGEFIGDLPLVAFNAKFDRAFLTEACDRVGRPAFGNKVSCALVLARRAWPGRSTYRLSDICSDAGIETRSEHRALPDCERALSVYVAAAQKLGLT